MNNSRHVIGLTTVGCLLISTTGWASPVVNSNTISWPEDGWYQVQDASSYESICQGGTSCVVTPGLYIVINHSTGTRYDAIEVLASGTSTPEQNEDGVYANGVIVSGNTIVWPDDGYYQVQRADDYQTICEDTRQCVVADGTYNVINLTLQLRTEGVIVPGQTTEPTEPIDPTILTEAEQIEAQAANSFLNLGFVTRNIDSLGTHIGVTNNNVRFSPDLNGDNNDELLERDFTGNGVSGLLPGNASLDTLDINDLIRLDRTLLPAAVLDFNGDGNPDIVSPRLDGVNPDYSSFSLSFGQGTLDDSFSALSEQPDIRINGVEPGQLRGARTPVGDVNGDGFDDLVILPDGVITPEGAAAHILYGRASFPVVELDISQLVPDLYGERLIADDGFRFRNIIALGDIDGNGFDDFALTYSETSKQGIGAYDTVIVFGSSARVTGASDTVSSALASGQLAVLDDVEIRYRVGDIDADGQMDVLIQLDEIDFFSGTEAILSPVQISAGQRYDSAALADRIVRINIDGHLINLYPAGDVDGDGFNDLLIEEFAVGNRVLVYAGTLTGKSEYTEADLLQASSPMFTSNTPYISSSSADRELVNVSYAYDIIAGGDINGDGHDDLLFQMSRFYRDSEVNELIVLSGGPR